MVYGTIDCYVLFVKLLLAYSPLPTTDDFIPPPPIIIGLELLTTVF